MCRFRGSREPGRGGGGGGASLRTRGGAAIVDDSRSTMAKGYPARNSVTPPTTTGSISRRTAGRQQVDDPFRMRRKLHAIRDRLRQAYGRPRLRPHRRPVDELILTVLSQNTNDRNRDVAFMRLRERLPSWEAVRRAPEDEIEEAIRPGGISRIKANRIQAILDDLDGDELEWMADAAMEKGRERLVELPGIGRKTAACVLLFSYGIPDVPVDTHVFRVGGRLGFWTEKSKLEDAHDVLTKLADDGDDAYEIHTNLLRHGRRICTARNPLCEQCPLLSLCPYGKARVRP
jgi:endonuclease III